MVEALLVFRFVSRNLLRESRVNLLYDMLSNRLCYPVTDFLLPETILQLLDNNNMQPLTISYSCRVSVSEARLLLVSSHQP